MSDLFSKPYDPQQTQKLMRTQWEQHQFFASHPSDKTPFVLMMPPPNVTGDLTMGHMMYTLQDVLIRWHRALGFESCWIPGTDHASIATEAKVTKMLADKGILKSSLNREEFLKHAWAWRETYGNRIVESLKSLGVSCDWNRNTFTMDEGYSNAVLGAIVQLYNEGLVYRSHRLVNWCPVSRSVISDEEVNFEQRSGHLWHIRYRREDKPEEYIVVATTRPETLFGDLAIAVHPQDERFGHLIGKKVKIPVCNRLIPVIADDYVDPEFGTGAVKITPAHDKNDFEVGKRHNLGVLNILNPDGSLNKEVPAEYQRLDRFVARKKLVAELQTQGNLEKTEPYNLTVGISERGKEPIEFYLSDQWYIKTDKLAQMALEATRSGKLTLVPEHQNKIWEHWLTNIQDWCISRQLWWGHRLPFYTCTSCAHLVASVATPGICPQCQNTQWKQDEDVLDTWASSWLWPFAVHQTKEDLNYYYPTDIIVTGPDIIFFWIARMVMAGVHFTQKVPFHHCYFTPIVRDSQGRKMSKSLGNSPDVLELMDRYGVDALRFSLINQIAPGQDIFWRDDSCELGKNFANKIWNAARFLTMHREKTPVQNISYDELVKMPQDTVLGWIVSAFQQMVEQAHKAIGEKRGSQEAHYAFQFSQYTSALYEFVWMTYCDWFVELIKTRLEEPETLQVAFQVFDGILRMVHPVMPFVTEHIWQELDPARQGRTLGFEHLPISVPALQDPTLLAGMEQVQNIVKAIRTIRGQFSIHPGTILQVALEVENWEQRLIAPMEFLAKAQFAFPSSPEFISYKEKFCAAQKVGTIKLYIVLEGHVDKQTEYKRLSTKIQKLQQTQAGIEKRLANQEFVASAPAAIVQGAQQQLAQVKDELALLQEAIGVLGG